MEKLPNLDEYLWPDLARFILENAGLVNDQESLEDIIAEATKVLQKPDLRFLFGLDTFAEVSVSAVLPDRDNQLMNGIIDRLIITDDDVIIVDYKTNRHVPSTEDEVPEGLLRQMGAYSAAITQIYPMHRVRPFILWTATGDLMSLTYLKVINCLQASPDA